jgi:hypothetical protein
MKQKRFEAIYTPNSKFESKEPLNWKEVLQRLKAAIRHYNYIQRRWYNSKHFLYRLFNAPNTYVLNYTETIDQGEVIYLIWIEQNNKPRLHFDLHCKQVKTKNSIHFKDGEKYQEYMLLGSETSKRWLDKMNVFLYKIMPYIKREFA